MKFKTFRPALSQRGAEFFWALYAPGLIALAFAWKAIRQKFWPRHCGLAEAIGHPCPLCGGSEAMRMLVRGRFLASLRAHPLVLPVLLLLVFITLYAWAARTCPALPVLRVEGWRRRHTALAIAGLTVLALGLVFGR